MFDAVPRLVTLTAAEAESHGIVGKLRLRRAWPGRVSSLALQYVDEAGAVVPAVWFADAQETLALEQKLDRCGGLLVRSDGECLGLYPHGADFKLPALKELLERPGARLVSHRPGRRAVVRLADGECEAYAKVLRPSRVDRVMRSYEVMSGLEGREFGVATIAACDARSGELLTHMVPGTNMAAVPSDDTESFVSACAEAGRALRSMHRQGPEGVPAHAAADEMSLLESRLACARALHPDVYKTAAAVAPRVFGALAQAPGRHTLIHRDYYDKQVMIAGDGRVTILDFDTLAVGEPSLDVANMLGHIELRHLQGACSADAAEAGARAFVDAYGGGLAAADPLRIGAYLDATRLRLAVLYAFWPKWSSLSPELLARIGTPFSVSEGSKRACGSGAGSAVEPDTGAGRGGCPLVCVVGCPRSGTTMLERMLDAHPDLAMAHETHWITKYGKRRELERRGLVGTRLLDRLYEDRRFIRMAPARDALEKVLVEQPCEYPTFVRLVYNLYREARGTAEVGDKSTGGYLRNLPRLHTICPATRVVHLVRDGRDVCLSMLTWPKAGRAAGRHPLWEVDPVAATAAWWRWHVCAGIEDGRPLGPEVYREFRYERLVADPAGQCAEVCRFLGLPPDPGMPAFYEGRSTPGEGRSANAAWLAPTPGLRDWRTQMPAESIEMFEAIAGDTLEELGYQRRFARISQAVAALAERYTRQWESQSVQNTAAVPESQEVTLVGGPQDKGETE